MAIIANFIGLVVVLVVGGWVVASRFRNLGLRTGDAFAVSIYFGAVVLGWAILPPPDLVNTHSLFERSIEIGSISDGAPDDIDSPITITATTQSPYRVWVIGSNIDATARDKVIHLLSGQRVTLLARKPFGPHGFPVVRALEVDGGAIFGATELRDYRSGVAKMRSMFLIGAVGLIAVGLAARFCLSVWWPRHLGNDFTMWASIAILLLITSLLMSYFAEERGWPSWADKLAVAVVLFPAGLWLIKRYKAGNAAWLAYFHRDEAAIKAWEALTQQERTDPGAALHIFAAYWRFGHTADARQLLESLGDTAAMPAVHRTAVESLRTSLANIDSAAVEKCNAIQ